MKEEKSRLEIENEKLHSKLDNFLMAREDAEEELKSLKSRHALVLDKALEDKELKEAALQERVSLWTKAFLFIVVSFPPIFITFFCAHSCNFKFSICVHKWLRFKKGRN